MFQLLRSVRDNLFTKETLRGTKIRYGSYSSPAKCNFKFQLIEQKTRLVSDCDIENISSSVFPPPFQTFFRTRYISVILWGKYSVKLLLTLTWLPAYTEIYGIYAFSNNIVSVGNSEKIQKFLFMLCSKSDKLPLCW